MATNDIVQFTIEHNGTSYIRSFGKADAKDNVIVLGRLSSSNPDEREILPSNQNGPIGGIITSKGRAAFISPVMSRRHARLVFQGAGLVYISDPPNHSHHGTFITRGSSTFRIEHPQPLYTGDTVIFGKVVHTGGQVYSPLRAKVRVIPGGPISGYSSFTGHGYSLPADIEEDFCDEEGADADVYKDDEQADATEDPFTHKFFAIENIADDEDNRSELNLSPLNDEAWRLPFPPLPHYPDSLSLNSSIRLPPVQTPWRMFYGPNPSPHSAHHNPYLPLLPGNPGSAQVNIGPINPFRSFFGNGINPPAPPEAPQVPQDTRPPLKEIEVIDVDADGKEIIDVDALASPSPLSPMEMASSVDDDADGSDDDDDDDDDEVGSGRSRSRSSEIEPSVTKRSEMESLKAILENVKDLATKLDVVLADRAKYKQRVSAEKVELEEKLKELQATVMDLQAKAEERLELNNEETETAVTDVQKHANELMDDMDQAKGNFMSDLEIYEDDVTFETDRVVEHVDELAAKMEKAKTRAEEIVKTLEDSSVVAQAQLDVIIHNVDGSSKVAIDTINQAVAGVKRRRDEMEEQAEDIPVRFITPPTEPHPSSELVDSTIPSPSGDGMDVTALGSPVVSLVKRRRLNTASHVALSLLAAGAAVYLGMGALSSDS